MDAERKAAVEAKGGLNYIDPAPVGESFMQLQAVIPRDDPAPGDGHPRGQFTVLPKNGDGKLRAWSVSKKSPLYRDLIRVLSHAPADLKLVRTGTGQKDTRYTLLVADGNGKWVAPE